MRRSKAQVLESTRQRAGEGDRLRDLRLPPRFVPQLELLPLSDEHDSLVEAGIAAQRRRNEDSAGGVEIDIVRVTDDQPLQAADRVIERRKTHQLRLDRFPRADRVNQQASPVVRRDHEAALAAGNEPVAMARGNGEPALGVEHELGYAAENDGTSVTAIRPRRFAA